MSDPVDTFDGGRGTFIKVALFAAGVVIVMGILAAIALGWRP